MSEATRLLHNFYFLPLPPPTVWIRSAETACELKNFFSKLMCNVLLHGSFVMYIYIIQNNLEKIS